MRNICFAYVFCLCNLISIISAQSSHEFDMNITFKNISISGGNETIYMCQMFKIEDLLPSELLNSKVQAIEEVAVFTTNKVHHIILYGCGDDVKFRPGPEECLIMDEECTVMLGGYAIGLPNVKFPKEAGMDLNSYNTKVLRMQIHYHNMDKQPFVDSSGLKIHYTDKPRRHSIGFLITGKKKSLIKLPPGERNINVTDKCSAYCLSRIQPEGLTVIGAILHGHQQLKRMRTEFTFKNGTVDNTTFRDDSYSFNSQYIKYLDNPFTLNRGDSIKTICEYDTSKLTEYVYGGPGSNDEMCIGFLIYYPGETGPISCSESIGCYYFSDLLAMRANNSMTPSGFLPNNGN